MALSDVPATTDLSGRLAAARVPVRIAYLGVVLLATLSGLRIALDSGEFGDRLARMWAFEVDSRDVIDGARNVTLFAGWGLVWMLTAAPGRTPSALRGAALTGAALSAFVESLQLLSGQRVASVLDLITNTAGALVGAVALVVVVRMLAALSAAKSLIGLPIVVFAVCVAAAALAEAFVPLFRQDVLVYGGPLERLAAMLREFRGPSVFELPLSDLVLFVPAGILVAAALFEFGANRRMHVIAAGMAAILVAAAEVLHGALGLRVDSSAVLVHVVGVVGGIGVGAWWIPPYTRSARGADRPRLLALAYSSVLALWMLRPYSPVLSVNAVVDKLQSDWWVPLGSLGGRMDMFSVVDVFAGFLLYLPLGALLAVWPLRRLGILAAFFPAIELAMVAEGAQVLIAGRFLDATDVLIQAAGAAVGWVVVRRAGYRPHGTLLN